MAKITRKTSVLFGSTAPAQTVEEFGSKTQLGSPNYTTDPAQIQALAAWTNGWTAAIAAGNKAPYVQDMNAFCLVDSYQISYILQQGVAEWDSATTYYKGSYVQDPGGSGQLWYSLVDANLNNTPPLGASNAFWNLFTALPPVSTRQVFLNGSAATYTTPQNVRQLRIRIVGGGGGGGADSVGSGAAGGTSIFNGVVAAAGAGGHFGGVQIASALGGSAGAGAASIRMKGGDGGPSGSSTGVAQSIGSGGGSGFGAGTGTPGQQAAGFAGAANTGAGGSGGDAGAGSANWGGGGGGGEYVELIINNPGATYTYTVGAGGAGGVGGTFGGGAGGSGIVIVDEFY